MSNNIAPKHIGYIVDGNRRWAKERGLSTYEGHLAGYKTISKIALASFDAGVKYVSAYIFSTENWKRSEEEVGKLMGLVMRLVTTDLSELEKNNIKLVILGSRDNLSDSVKKAVDKAVLKTANNTAGTLALCFNYGGHQEIIDAVKKIVQSGASADEVSTDLIEQNLYGPEIPPVDLVVRTSGEQRISNFMLWRIAYSEMMFLDKYWPDMTESDVADIINEYNSRSRRFGG
ncbi:di-trans,poly-cis-decaprenylcistransferase [Candidatus Saccharibacteria bacterium HGW-Saccharibacteria-1]|jgi:undecaprenyl diphosphate synthase|nr:MAG: di-trans,poly-cis-decaprenylcistransferase [Candidatus Saccharibacteria bacterium HGW-Saccharibacteria-1]